ncbi:alpha-hydroxy-acid oxidizing protein, partial [Klebsiella pneumoniae]|uniref:alpha-hydroxy-acid oxidizing protein n=1 Tax=Klebsiella pneumoniae TaxID=573 RepID=UPI001CED03B4
AREAARAASRAGIPYTLSTVSVCSIEEVASHASGALWSQLYVLKDRDYMRNALERAWAAGMKTLVFTVDMPITVSYTHFPAPQTELHLGILFRFEKKKQN